MYTTHELTDAELASIARGRGDVRAVRKIIEAADWASR